MITKEMSKTEQEIDFQKTLENAFLAYGGSIAQDRALPDVRDFLKPGLRQGLYAQYTNHLTFKDKFQKAQKSVAAGMAQSYVHGDQALYDTFIRAARPWSYRYPLIAVQGNCGNPSSPDSHAASRYVEMKAGEIADIMFDGLKQNAIGNQWYSNYDDTEMIPRVFPSIGYWNICNGCYGIGVAMATSCPTFNLKEVNAALIALLENNDADYDTIYCAPDFPTGGTVVNAQEVKESLKKGTGAAIHIRAKLSYDAEQNMIRATEIPYGVFTNTIIDQLSAITTENENYGIRKVIDHTKSEADIRIYLEKHTNPSVMIEKLYQDTSLENSYGINMIFLDEGRFPRIFGWREACIAYLNHARQCQTNICKYELDKAMARLHIVEGLLIAAASIDEVVSIIRKSDDITDASNKLIARFHFTDEQVKAILAIKLAALTRIDAIKLNNEHDRLNQYIAHLNEMLLHPSLIDAEIIRKLQAVSDKFGDARRTQIIDYVAQETDTEIPLKNVGLLLFNNNTLRMVDMSDVPEDKRGKRGNNLRVPKNARLINTLYTTTHARVCAFTQNGIMRLTNLVKLDFDTDYNTKKLFDLKNEESVILLIDEKTLNQYKYILTVTKFGYVKKVAATEYFGLSRKRINATKLVDGDSIIAMLSLNDDNDEIFICTNLGRYFRYSTKDLPVQGRLTRGVASAKLNNNEYIISANLLRSTAIYYGILTVTKSGLGKISKIEDFSKVPRTSKASHYVMKIKTGDEISACQPILQDTKQIYLATETNGINLNIATIPVQGRITTGVKLINPTDRGNNIYIIN